MLYSLSLPGCVSAARNTGGMKLIRTEIEQFVFNHKPDHVVINEPFLLLVRIHQCFFTYAVDYPGNPCRGLMDFIDDFARKYILCTSGIIHMTLYVLFCFRPVKMGKCTIHIYPLTDSGITAHFQFVLPEFRLSDEYKGHRTFGIELIIQKEPEFFKCFLLDEMCLIQNADDLFVLETTDDLDLLLELPLGIPTIEP